MSNSTALIAQFNSEIDELPTIPSVSEAFQVPNRNWNSLIDNYNTENKKKFFFTALECKSIVEHVKRSVPPQFLFKSKGISRVRYSNILTAAAELQDRFETLFEKDSLNDGEQAEFLTLLRHPLRVLVLDILMAEGIADLLDWEEFNVKAGSNQELLAMKMKAKFKEFFGDKTTENVNATVQINLGGKWVLPEEE